jgi:hypothetical protein
MFDESPMKAPWQIERTLISIRENPGRESMAWFGVE